MTADELRAIRERNEERKQWIADGCGGIELEEPQTADIDALLAEVERLQAPVDLPPVIEPGQSGCNVKEAHRHDQRGGIFFGCMAIHVPR